MGRFAVLAESFEHLSYPLGRLEPSDKGVFSEHRENFIFHRMSGELDAEMSISASDALSLHAALPVGFVFEGDSGFFLVCKTVGRQPSKSMPAAEKSEFCRAVVERLSALHSEGLGCGGLSPDAVEFSGKEARLLNPAKIFAANESDSLFFEAVSTLRSLVSKGFANKKELPALASLYLSTPACREAVFSYMREKKLSGLPHLVLSEAARKYAAYF